MMQRPEPAAGEEPGARRGGAALPEVAGPAGETAFSLRLVARPSLPLRPEAAAAGAWGTTPEPALPPDAPPGAEPGAERPQVAGDGVGRVPRTGREGPPAESDLHRGADPASTPRPDSPGVLPRTAGAGEPAEPPDTGPSSLDRAPARAETQPGVPLDGLLARAPVARRLEFRVPIAGGSMVDLLLTDRAGSLQVAVRGREAETVGELRRELGTLVGNLRQLGFRTEAWNPLSGTSGPLPADRSETRDSALGGGDSGAGGYGWGAGKDNQDDSRHQPPPRPLPGRNLSGSAGEAGPDGEQEIEEWLQRLRV